MELSKIATEKRNENTLHIDELSTRDMVKLINDEDKKVAEAVEKELDHIAAAIDLIADKLSKGGRLIYTGCGTSGRLGILDAVECPPTYSTDPETVMGIIAGGYPAIFKAVEGAEDDASLGEEDLKKVSFSEKDVLVGLAASGRTPYRCHEICQIPGSLRAECNLLQRLGNRPVGRYRHRTHARVRSYHRLHPDEEWNRRKNGSQHAFHWLHD